MDTSTASEAARIEWSQPTAGWNEWKQLAVPALGEWTPELRLAVIIPARNDQIGLDLTVASLAEQTYPEGLFEVVIVDDASDPALELPARRPGPCRIIRLEEQPGFGAGKARRAGAAAVDADVLLFADSDIVLCREHLEAHARWHHAVDYAVTFGYREFVEFSDLSVDQVADAVRDGRMPDLLSGRVSEEHDWIIKILRRSAELTARDEDPFRVAVGANLGVRRDLYLAAGEFATFGRRGIEDTETAYRLQMAGGLFVPEPLAHSWHEGLRTMAGAEAAQIRRQRLWLLEHHLAVPRYRSKEPGRQFAVPMLEVALHVLDEPAEVVIDTASQVLASDFTDLRLTLVVAEDHPDLGLLEDAFGPDGRVELAAEPPEAVRSPFILRLFAGYQVGPHAIGRLMREINRRQVGALRLVPPGGIDPRLLPTLWRTDARARAQRVCGRPEQLEEAIGALYGEWWLDGTEFDVVDPATSEVLREAGTAKPAAQEPGAQAMSATQAEARALQERLRQKEQEVARLRSRKALRLADKIGRLRRRLPGQS